MSICEGSASRCTAVLVGVDLCGGDLDALLQRLREHGRPNALRARLDELLVHLLHLLLREALVELLVEVEHDAPCVHAAVGHGRVRLHVLALLLIEGACNTTTI